MNSRDAERQELERAIDLLGRSTRHARLLDYVGAKYFQQQEEQLTEFNIATEVFGRSTKQFAATQDAVVRVEVHRLRKKLREIYEKDTRTQGLQVSLPPGTYVPKFTSVPGPPKDSAGTAREAGGLRRFLKWPLYLSILAMAAVAVTLVINNGSQDVQTAPPRPSPAAQPAPPPSPAAGRSRNFM